jgi:sensor c-di-GMP phosphodiesterase-like protein
MAHRRQAALAGGLVFAMALAGSAALAYADAWLSTRLELAHVARSIGARSLQVRREATDLEAEFPPGDTCDKAKLRDLVAKSHYIRNVGKIRGNRLFCDAFDGEHAVIDLGQAQTQRSDNVRFWITPNAIWVARGPNAITFDSTSFIDALLPAATQVAVIEAESGRLLVSSETLPPPLVEKAWRAGEATFKYKGNLIAVVRSRDRRWLEVAIRPMSAVHKEILAALPHFMLAGFLAGLALAVATVITLGRRRALPAELRRALQRDKFQIALQPIVCFERGRPVVHGFECLARWSVAGEEIPPAVFIPMVERDGLGADLARTVLRRLVEDFGATLRAHPKLYVAINLSSAEVADADLLDDIDRILADASIAPGQIVIELTERVFEAEGMAKGLERLRLAGHRLSIDDFGTGASNASRLAQFSPELVKVDRSFVVHADGDGLAATLLPQLVEMARGCGAHVVVEGVETREQAQRLGELGEVLAQGFYWHPPMDAAQATQLVGTDGASSIG